MSDEVEKIKKIKLESLMEKFSQSSSHWPKKPLKITDHDMTDVVNSYPIVVVDCWAPWCGPCRMLGPIIDELAKKMQGKVAFAKLNTDENRRIASQYGIMSIQTILLFKNGDLVDRNVGALPPDMLHDWIMRFV